MFSPHFSSHPPVYKIDRGEFMNEWVKIKDRLPEHTGMILVYGDVCGIELGFFSKRDNKITYADDDDWILEIKTATHWMPLPEPPKKE